MLVRYGIHPVHKQAHIAFRISKKKSNELEFTGAGVPTLSVQGIIKHVIGPVNAGAGAPPLCLQAYFIELENIRVKIASLIWVQYISTKAT